ncbi:TetR/AcrR family transcriptional regulator [Neorhizobium petrolearium]|uniref:TetR/AcrR family transcriptional regulator n=1 Tax=Neorhizobium petrolearium TaxID=515361 RepID=UPI001F2C7755|nr:TetR/AcrR family transcriptional regulator [Neorhizobium petrolearium]
MTKRRNDPIRMRERISEDAFAAFMQHGYASTGMQDIRQITGVSGGALAHHFPAKRDLLLEVIRTQLGRAVYRTCIEPFLAAPDALQGVRAMFGVVRSELRDAEVITGCPLNNLALELSTLDVEAREELDRLFQKWREAIAERIGKDVELGLAQFPDPGKMATLIVASFSGAMSMAKASQSVEQLESCGNQIEDLMSPHYTRLSEY